MPAGKLYKYTAKPKRRYAPMGELKNLDTIVGAFTVTAAGVIANPSLNLVPQGVTDVTRVGRKIRVKSLHMRGSIFLPSSGQPDEGSDVVRMIIYLDKQANKAAPAVLDILETASYQSFNNLNNRGRFLILSDKSTAISFTAGEAANSFEVQRTMKFNKKLNIPVEFSGADGLIGEITSNNLGILAISQAGQMQLAYTTRIRYTDF